MDWGPAFWGAVPVRVHLDAGRVQRQHVHGHGDDPLFLQPGEQPLDHPGPRPTREPLVHRVPIPELGGQVTPRATRAHHPQHRVHEHIVVDPHIPTLDRQQPTDPIELLPCDLHTPIPPHTTPKLV